MIQPLHCILAGIALGLVALVATLVLRRVKKPEPVVKSRPTIADFKALNPEVDPRLYVSKDPVKIKFDHSGTIYEVVSVVRVMPGTDKISFEVDINDRYFDGWIEDVMQTMNSFAYHTDMYRRLVNIEAAEYMDGRMYSFVVESALCVSIAPFEINQRLASKKVIEVRGYLSIYFDKKYPDNEVQIQDM